MSISVVGRCKIISIFVSLSHHILDKSCVCVCWLLVQQLAFCTLIYNWNAIWFFFFIQFMMWLAIGHFAVAFWRRIAHAIYGYKIKICTTLNQIDKQMHIIMKKTGGQFVIYIISSFHLSCFPFRCSNKWFLHYKHRISFYFFLRLLPLYMTIVKHDGQKTQNIIISQCMRFQRCERQFSCYFNIQFNNWPLDFAVCCGIFYTKMCIAISIIRTISIVFQWKTDWSCTKMLQEKIVNRAFKSELSLHE